MTSGPTSRRTALQILARWSGAIAAAGIAPGCAPAFGAGSERLTRVARLDQVPPGSALRTSYRNEPLIVVNVGGSVRAFSGLCTHEGCELGWNDQQRLIRCPCHASAFDTSGRVVSGPAPKPLPEFRTIVRGGRIYVVE